MKGLAPLLVALAAAASPVSGPATDDSLVARIAAAAPGAVVVVSGGDHRGPFVIDKPLRLHGQGGATLRGDGLTHVVAVRAADVEVTGFVIRGSGRRLADDHAAIHVTGSRAWIHGNQIVDTLHGIYVRKADDCRIENNVILGDGTRGRASDPIVKALKPGENELCDIENIADRRGNGIHLWSSVGHRISGNTIRGTRDGIYFSFADRTHVQGNRISEVRYGLHYMYSDENVFEDNVFSENSAGAALMSSQGLVLRGNRFIANRSHRAYGLLLHTVEHTVIEDNEIAGNTLGLFMENGNGNTVRGNRIAANYVGLRASDSTADSRFFENAFGGNIHPVETSGANAANAWSVGGRGNHWEGAVSLDLNRDGIADVAHRETDLFGPWRRSFPVIGLLSASPGERLLRFIHSRLAIPGVPGINDPRPLTTITPKP